MPPQIRHYGIINNGKVKLLNLPLYKKNIDSLEGKRIEFTIKEVHEFPTPDQHAYYRGAVIETALQAECFGGWTNDEVHKELADLFLGTDIVVRVVRKDGTVIAKTRRDVPSTADLSKKEMTAYIDKCIMFLAAEGIEVHTAEMYKLNKYRTVTTTEK